MPPVNPEEAQYLPATQSVQAGAPAKENLPAAQPRQELEVPNEYVPPSHEIQTEEPAALTVAEYMPPLHPTQVEAPEPGW